MRLGREKAIRALIVEIESPERNHLRAALGEKHNIEIISECSSVAEGVDLIQRERPDLLLLDVQLPGEDGFAVLRAIPREEHPATIIMTAVSDHASKAFEHDVVDYLLKPFDGRRLDEAIRKARARLNQKQLAPAKNKETIALRSGGRWILLKLKEIDAVAAHQHASMVYAGEGRRLVRETLTAIEQQLPADRFFRINRATIINGDRVRVIRSKSHGDGIVELVTGQSYTLSRRFRSRLKGFISNQGGGDHQSPVQ